MTNKSRYTADRKAGVLRINGGLQCIVYKCRHNRSYKMKMSMVNVAVMSSQDFVRSQLALQCRCSETLPAFASRKPTRPHRYLVSSADIPMYLLDLNVHCSSATVEVAEPDSLQKKSTNLAHAQMPADRVVLPAVQLQLPAQMPAVQVADGAVPTKHVDIPPKHVVVPPP